MGKHTHVIQRDREIKKGYAMKDMLIQFLFNWLVLLLAFIILQMIGVI